MGGGGGVMGASLPQGKLPNTHYRVSAKAVIVRDDGLVLCVKEGGDNYWNLPGGGIDFGENLQEALSRELHEEVGFSGDFSMKILGAETFFAEKRDTWKMNIIVKIVPDNFNFSLGRDADEVAFKSPQEFADSSFPDERYIYEYGCEEAVK